MKNKYKIFLIILLGFGIIIFLEFGANILSSVFIYRYLNREACFDAVIFILIFIAYITIFIFYYKLCVKDKVNSIYHTIVLGVSYSVHIIFLCIGFFVYFFTTLFGPNGYSYTQNIKNYLITDSEMIQASFFPDEITSEMKNVKYGYFYAITDAWAIELYLEVQFEDSQTLDKYLDLTLSKVKKENITLKNNEFDSSYNTYYIENSYIYVSELSSGNYDIEGNMDSVSYSYETNTIIFSSISFCEYYTSDYPIPFYFERFGIEINNDTEISSK